MKKKLTIFFIIMLIVAIVPVVVNAAEITDFKITLNGESINKKVLDNKEGTFITVSSKDTILIDSEENIDGIYIIYRLNSQKGTITAMSSDDVADSTEKTKTAEIGENDFLHEYINVNKKIGETKKVKLQYDKDVKIADIYVLGKGNLPDFVEVWEKPCEKADLVLFSTHSDDEQLFFLGLMPTYVARGAAVQVVYFANHNDNPSRLHEQLHGLYTVGIRHYPVLGLIPDAYSLNLKTALSNMTKAGISEDEAIKFQVEMMRRFKPQVVVGHDEKGEYGHGQHILNTYLLEKAIKLVDDKTYDNDSLDKYGAWQPKKLYLHLYKENEITMDYDTPLDYFNGKTAYEVSKEGYSKHKSQQWTWFTDWINGKKNSYKKATEIKTYSPLKYGLYFTSVGEDIEKNDMFENLTFYEKSGNKDSNELREEEKIDSVKDDISKTENEESSNEIKQKESSDNKFFIILGVVCVVLIFVILIFTKRPKRTKRGR